MNLNKYQIHSNYQIGVPKWRQVLWYFIGFPLIRCGFITNYTIKIHILRLFGAEIGRGVVVKSGVRVKYPWKLKIGDDSWIGENVWIDNLAEVKIGINSCLSQGAYLCTGSHDWSKDSFDLIAKPIVVGDSVWIGAKAQIAPGVIVGEGAVLTLGSVAVKNLDPWSINQGNPARQIKIREIYS